MTFVALRRDIVIVVCAISAGIHGALAPGHFAEGSGPGVGFAASTVVLGAIAVAVTLRPVSTPALTAARATLVGLLVAYGLAITIGVPILHPEPERIDGLALTTKAIELVGVLAAWSLVRRPSVALIDNPHLKGTSTT
jgi:hypothetical protein